MFARFFALASLVAFVAATPLALRDGQCNTGSIKCCNSSYNSVSQYNDSPEAVIYGLLPVVAGVEAGVGLSCSPITGIGSSGNRCEQQPMCCSNNTYNGVVNVGCTPISVL